MGVGSSRSEDTPTRFPSLRGSRQFSAVYRRGKRRDGRYTSVRMLRNDLKSNRYGFAISKKIGGAVQRNRLRRRLRHILAELQVEPGWDIVVNARPGGPEAPYSALRAEVASLLGSGRVRAEGKSN
ncbi:MAG: ribonuclease P protein component [Dehalococcoidia bacterium]|nr:ribonuclease P protein component [Dehalococcoidia bacterium]